MASHLRRADDADSPYFNKDLDGTYSARARARLLAEAGHANGVDASMVVFQGLGIYTTMAQVIQANLKEAGINLKLEPVEWATLVERKNRGDYESMIYGVSVKLPDPDACLGGDSSYWAKPIGYRDAELENCWPPVARRPTSRRASRFTTRPKTHPGNQSLAVRELARAGAGLSAQGARLHAAGRRAERKQPGISLPTMWLD